MSNTGDSAQDRPAAGRPDEDGDGGGDGGGVEITTGGEGTTFEPEEDPEATDG